MFKLAIGPTFAPVLDLCYSVEFCRRNFDWWDSFYCAGLSAAVDSTFPRNRSAYMHSASQRHSHLCGMPLPLPSTVLYLCLTAFDCLQPRPPTPSLPDLMPNVPNLPNTSRGNNLNFFEVMQP